MAVEVEGCEALAEAGDEDEAPVPSSWQAVRPNVATAIIMVEAALRAWRSVVRRDMFFPVVWKWCFGCVRTRLPTSADDLPSHGERPTNVRGGPSSHRAR